MCIPLSVLISQDVCYRADGPCNTFLGRRPNFFILADAAFTGGTCVLALEFLLVNFCFKNVCIFA